MKIIVTGGAGFIANTLIRNLLLNGDEVIAVDNLALGSELNLVSFLTDHKFRFKNLDLVDRAATEQFFMDSSADAPIDAIWHLAANSDIPRGVIDPEIDFRNTFQTTFELLLVAKKFKIKNFYFASSSAVYGDMGSALISEGSGPLLPISNYGAMKLASEAQISASAESFLEKAVIFRFPNVVGTPATHGIILDFIKKLRKNKNLLEVLGNGTQSKSYLHVTDLVSAMLHIIALDKSKVSIYNIGQDDDCVSVKWIAERVVARISPEANISFGLESRGWVGDVPRFRYDTSKLQGLGWTPKLNSRNAIELAISEIRESV